MNIKDSYQDTENIKKSLLVLAPKALTEIAEACLTQAVSKMLSRDAQTLQRQDTFSIKDSSDLLGVCNGLEAARKRMGWV